MGTVADEQHAAAERMEPDVDFLGARPVQPVGPGRGRFDQVGEAGIDRAAAGQVGRAQARGRLPAIIQISARFDRQVAADIEPAVGQAEDQQPVRAVEPLLHVVDAGRARIVHQQAEIGDTQVADDGGPAQPLAQAGIAPVAGDQQVDAGERLAAGFERRPPAALDHRKAAVPPADHAGYGLAYDPVEFRPADADARPVGHALQRDLVDGLAAVQVGPPAPPGQARGQQVPREGRHDAGGGAHRVRTHVQPVACFGVVVLRHLFDDHDFDPGKFRKTPGDDAACHARTHDDDPHHRSPCDCRNPGARVSKGRAAGPVRCDINC